MSITQIISLAINVSMFLIVFALGLHASLDNATYLFRHPRLFFRSILAMNIVMLGFAIAVILLFQPPAPIKIALVALAVSPVPPVLPGKQFKAGGSVEYTIGLLTGAAAVSIVLVPLAIEEVGRAFGFNTHAPIGKVISIVLISTIVPLAAGVGVHHFLPAFAGRIARPVSLFATSLLIAAFLPVLVMVTPRFWSLVGSGALLCLGMFTLVGIAVGHLLGGPHPDNRAVLALAAGTRHPGMAMAIASINFPGEKDVLAVVLFHLIIGGIISLPYIKWHQRVHAVDGEPGATLS